MFSVLETSQQKLQHSVLFNLVLLGEPGTTGGGNEVRTGIFRNLVFDIQRCVYLCLLNIFLGSIGYICVCVYTHIYTHILYIYTRTPLKHFHVKGKGVEEDTNAYSEMPENALPEPRCCRRCCGAWWSLAQLLLGCSFIASQY